MLHRRCACLLVLLSSVAFADGKSNPPSAAHKNVTSKLPVTTSSVEARKRFEQAMQNLEYIRSADALNDLRKAVKADPNFAQALILISHLSRDPDEQRATRSRAKLLAAGVSPGERLLIRWLAGVQEDNYGPAIAALHDLLTKYPRDQRLALLARGRVGRQAGDRR